MLNMYDEDNIDLEEQMYLMDIQNEEDEEYNEEDTDESSELYDENDYDLTKPFLDVQASLADKDKKEITVCFKKTGKIFKGIVLGKSTTDSDKYVFKAVEVTEDGESEIKTKIFKFADIKKF